MTLPGVDVSSFQGEPAAWRGEAGRIQWAAVKLTEVGAQGTYVDPYAPADWDFLKARGLGRVAYLFGHPDVSASVTVARFVTELRSIGLEDGDGVAVDLEVTDGLAPREVDAWALEVLRDLDAQLDRRPLIYSYPAFIEAGNCASLGAYPLWLANPSAPSGHPDVPEPWKTAAMQQTGITGAIDRDVAFYDDLAAMQAALGKRKPPAPPRIVHWHAIGLWSLAREAQEHKTTPEEMLRLAKAAGHKYHPAMERYIERGDWSARVPHGTELFARAS